MATDLTSGSDTKQRAQAAAATAGDEARETASIAMQEASDVKEEVKNQARNLIEESRTQLHSEAQQQTDRVAGTVRNLGEQLHALAEGRTDQAGIVADYAREAAQRVHGLASRLDERGFDGAIDDVKRFARRRPGMFLLGAAAAGFAVGRILRNANDQQQSQARPSGYSQYGGYGTGEYSGRYGVGYGADATSPWASTPSYPTAPSSAVVDVTTPDQTGESVSRYAGTRPSTVAGHETGTSFDDTSAREDRP